MTPPLTPAPSPSGDLIEIARNLIAAKNYGQNSNRRIVHFRFLERVVAALTSLQAEKEEAEARALAAEEAVVLLLSHFDPMHENKSSRLWQLLEVDEVNGGYRLARAAIRGGEHA